MTPSLPGDLAAFWRTHPFRQAAAVLAFWVALVLLMLLGALHDGLRAESRRLAASLGDGDFAVLAPADAPGWPVHAVRDLAERLAPSLAVAGFTDSRETLLPDGSSAAFVGVCGDPAAARDASWSPASPPPAAWNAAGHAAWLPANGGAPGTPSPSAIDTADGPSWRVAGTFALAAAPPGIPPEACWVPAPALALDAPGDPPAVRILLARARPPLAPADARRLLAGALPRTTPPGDCDWLTPERLLAPLRRATRTLSWSLTLASAFSLLLAALTLGSLLLLGVRERTPEIGLRRALGARPAQIAALFLLEASTLVAAALAAALPALWMLLPALSAAAGIPLRPTPATVLLPAAVAFSAALLSALPPALRAARLDPVDALRAP